MPLLLAELDALARGAGGDVGAPGDSDGAALAAGLSAAAALGSPDIPHLFFALGGGEDGDGADPAGDPFGVPALL